VEAERGLLIIPHGRASITRVKVAAKVEGDEGQQLYVLSCRRAQSVSGFLWTSYVHTSVHAR
jgi:hypothetical protein